MYGFVNKAIEEMVLNKFDQQTWVEIRQKANISETSFVCMQAYPDDVTYRLVEAASSVLEMPTSTILEAFGEYWVGFAAESGYSDMMDVSGDNLPEFLDNLDELHSRVGAIFPKLQPPSFDCEEKSEDELNLQYFSERKGLGQMILGLIKGLGKRFNTDVEVTQTMRREDGFDHDEYNVKYKEKSIEGN